MKEFRATDKPRGLLGDGRDDARVSMADIRHCNAAHAVNVAVPLIIVDNRAFAAPQPNGALVSGNGLVTYLGVLLNVGDTLESGRHTITVPLPANAACTGCSTRPSAS